MLNGGERYCLWLLGANPSDLSASPELKKRLEAVRQMRAASKAGSTAAAAQTPALFVQLAQPTRRYLAVPRVSSESRPYVPTAFYEPDVIASDLLLTISDADLTIFGAMSSKAFSVWNGTVSGRLESRLRISAEVTYNNYPWPTLDDAARPAIEAAAQVVLDARAAYPDATLATLYGRLTMPADLVRAHLVLDAAVLRGLGLRAKAGEAEILARLFERYEDLVLAHRTAAAVASPRPGASR